MNRSPARLRLRGIEPRAWRRSFGEDRRPSSAPKPMLDMKHIRQNAHLYEQTCVDRKYDRLAGHASRIVALHGQWLDLQREGRSMRERSKYLRKMLARQAASDDGTNSSSSSSSSSIRDEDQQQQQQPPSAESQTSTTTREQALDEARRLKADLARIEKGEAAAVAEMEMLALELPNLTSDDAPRGNEPTLLRYINSPPAGFDEPCSSSTTTTCSSSSSSFPSPHPTDEKPPRTHVEIGTELGILDLAAGATSSGWGWYYLIGAGAQLEQALIQYALGLASQRRFTPVSPPSLVYSHVGAACGFRPRDHHGEQQVYSVDGTPDRCLAGTSEIALAAMAAQATLPFDVLPLRRVAVSRCYRAEAGARGADTKGLFRVHEFTKVELFAWSAPETETARRLLDEMVALQVDILASLGLYSVVVVVVVVIIIIIVDDDDDDDDNDQAANDGWGELTSASLCTDYQTRRLATRVRLPSESNRLAFPYTINATALAVPRVLAALLEYGWDEASRTVVVPRCLRPWMHGMRRIGGPGGRPLG
ncbi:hypothetical protein XA68_17202 [Ophiocordyceps unilateralis]|uniref:serine--tRNA ligase n=1 Tax=Ophiocordyceps unilateralis TaxID=268505 RepID=A0A2A9P4W0_OPHUN|nr:hypothetical protein XA68_17202 [Ophiocordyceps unilateralis]